MDRTSIIKGIHPGIYLEWELKKRKLNKRSFAKSIHVIPQTLSAITKGKRRMNASLSLKIESALGIEEGLLMVLQAYNDIEETKKNLHNNTTPDLSKIRSVIFWDSDINKIDWQKNKFVVAQRIAQRGNDEEVQEIIRYYGRDVILEILEKLNPAESNRLSKYL
jgi:addiction module HigA family antidote